MHLAPSKKARRWAGGNYPGRIQRPSLVHEELMDTSGRQRQLRLVSYTSRSCRPISHKRPNTQGPTKDRPQAPMVFFPLDIISIGPCNHCRVPKFLPPRHPQACSVNNILEKMPGSRTKKRTCSVLPKIDEASRVEARLVARVVS